MFSVFLAQLVDALEREGFALGVDGHLRLRRLLEYLPENAPPELLRDALSTIVAKTPDEQKQFALIFDRCRKETENLLGQLDFELPPPAEPEPEPVDDDDGKKQRRNNRLRFAGAVGLYLALLIAADLFLSDNNFKNQVDYPPVPTAVDITAGANTTITLDSNALAGFPRPALRYGFSGDTATTLQTPLARYTLRDDGGRVLAEAGNTPGTDTLNIHLTSFSTQMDGLKQMTVAHRLIWKLSVRIAPPIAQETTGQPEIAHRFQYLPDDRIARDSLLMRLRAPAPDPVLAWLARWHWPLKTGLLLLLGGLLAWLVWRRERRRTPPLVAEQQRPDRPPYVWNIQLDEAARRIEHGPSFYTLVNRLRRREEEETRRFDLPATIAATIEKGGLPQFRFRPLTRPPEYLLLIDRRDANDHRAALYDQLARALQNREVLIDRYFFNGDPRLCWNEQHPQGLGLRELANRHPFARLVVLSTGHALLGVSGRFAAWTKNLDAWRTRALLSPLDPAAWGQAERRLSERFTLLPAAADSLSWLAELDREATPGVFLPATVTPPPPPIPLGGPLIDTLRRYYSAAELRWIAACAVWPSVHYDLTLWLGRLLRSPRPAPAPRLPWWRRWLPRLRPAPAPDAPRRKAEPLIAAAELQSLFRLEWFGQGEIPRAERDTLVQWLETTDPGLLRYLRAALHGLLAQHPPPPDSAAWPEFEMNLALSEWLSTADPWRKAELETRIAELLRRGVKPDFTVARYLDRPRSPLDFILPEGLKKLVHPAGRPGLGWYGWWRDMLRAGALWIACLAAALWWRPQAPAQCTGNLVGWRGEVLCLKDTRDEALYRERLACEQVPGMEIGKDAETYGEMYRTYSRMYLFDLDSARRDYHRYGALAFYNRGVQFSRGADSLRARGDGAAQRFDSLACVFFRQAALTDPTLPEAQTAAAWCDNPDAALPPSAAPERYADRRTRDLVLGFRDLFGQKGYVFEENYPNLIALRKTQNRAPDAWEDYLVVLYRDVDSVWQSQALICTTMPGQYYVQNPQVPEGAAMIAPGQYPAAYTPGTQRSTLSDRSPVLKQTGRLSIYRDADKSGSISGGDPRLSGNDFGLTIHPVYTGSIPDKVGSSSAGAIVLPRQSDWAAFQRRYETAYAAQKRPFTLTLFAQDEAPGPAALLFATAPGPSPSTITSPPSTFDPPPSTSSTTASAAPQRPGPAMVLVEGGRFTMGCLPERDGNCNDDEQPSREVQIRSFYIDPTEVTNSQYAAFLNAYGSDQVKEGAYAGQTMVYEYRWGVQKDPATGAWRPAAGYEQHPAVYVTWYGAHEYARFYGLRLPSEAEWEYAARGGKKTKGYRYAGSNNLDEVAWYYNNANSTTHAVRGKNPNELGLYDMSGNVWEWCADTWHENYQGAPIDGSAWTAGGDSERAVLRGGSWLDFDLNCRAAYRLWYFRNNRTLDYGFRCARDGQ